MGKFFRFFVKIFNILINPFFPVTVIQFVFAFILLMILNIPCIQNMNEETRLTITLIYVLNLVQKRYRDLGIKVRSIIASFFIGIILIALFRLFYDVVIKGVEFSKYEMDETFIDRVAMLFLVIDMVLLFVSRKVKDFILLKIGLKNRAKNNNYSKYEEYNEEEDEEWEDDDEEDADDDEEWEEESEEDEEEEDKTWEDWFKERFREMHEDSEKEWAMEIFGLTTLNGITNVHLRNIYYKLIKKYHPDKNQDNVKFAEEKTKEIIEAYNILKEWVA